MSNAEAPRDARACRDEGFANKVEVLTFVAGDGAGCTVPSTGADWYLRLVNFDTVGKWAIGPARATKDRLVFDSTGQSLREVHIGLEPAKRLLGRNRPEQGLALDRLRPCCLGTVDEIIEVRLTIETATEAEPHGLGALDTLALRLEVTVEGP